MAYERSLLERIARPEEANSYKLGVDENKIVDSVLEHLRKMFNVRQGSTPTLDDYGLPDFNDLVSKFPDAIMEIRKAIKACIEKYEPRLRNVRVEHVPDEENPLSLRYDITAQLFIEETKSKVWFETTLDSDGHVRVRG